MIWLILIIINRHNFKQVYNMKPALITYCKCVSEMMLQQEEGAPGKSEKHLPQIRAPEEGSEDIGNNINW